MRLAIVGAGAMGSLFASRLQADGNAVTLVDVRHELVNAITADGLTITEHDGGPHTVHPEATTDVESLEEPDAVLLFVKSYDTRDALADLAGVLTDDVPVATLQNGLPNYDAIGDVLGADRALGGYSTFGATLEAPGCVTLNGRGDNVLGGPDTHAAERLATTCSAAGLPTEAVDEPRPHIWHKQFVNVAIKPAAVLSGLPDGPLWEVEATQRVMRRLVEEAVEVARARDVEILGDPIETIREACLANYDKQSSMLVDIEAGRRTEIDAITGAVVDYGEDAGVEVPSNRLATDLVKAREYAAMQS